MSVNSVWNQRVITVKPLGGDDEHFPHHVDIASSEPSYTNRSGGTYTQSAVEALIHELAEAIGKTATLEPTKPVLPTEPGVYVGRNMAHLPSSAQIYKLKDYGWTDANGNKADIERVERLARNSHGLVRLVPEGGE